MFLIVRVVVFQHEGADVVETFDDHTLIVKIGEAEGTRNGGHAIFLAEGDDPFNQGAGNFLVVDEIEPAETDFLVVPVPIRNFIDDCCYPSDKLSVLIGEETAEFRILDHGILFGIQGGHLVEIEVGDIVGAALVKAEREFHERTEILPGADFLNGYRHG